MWKLCSVVPTQQGDVVVIEGPSQELLTLAGGNVESAELLQIARRVVASLNALADVSLESLEDVSAQNKGGVQ